MTKKIWTVEGIHSGKRMTDLPITYLLWFVGSPVMRRTRWSSCQIALAEIRLRLSGGTTKVEADLMAGLHRKSFQERVATKLRRRAYAKSKARHSAIA